MPKKKSPEEQPAEGILVSAAKTIGEVAGKVVAAVGGSGEQKKSSKIPKLAKKHKSHLPRKVKKAQKKGTQSQ
jgi:hypothetical protein